MVSLVCGRDRTGFPRFSQAGRYQKHYQPAEPRRVTAIIFIEYYSVVIGEFQSFTQFYHNRPFYHTPTKKASVILRPLAARTALYLYYTRTSGKGKRFLPVSILFRNRHFIITRAKWQALSIHESVTQDPLYLFFSMCPLYRFLVKWQALFCLRFCLPFLWIHV